MDLVYFKLANSNFGDDLNLWLWDDVLPGWRDRAPGTHLMGAGTILNDRMAPEGPKLVLGSGWGYGGVPDISGADWDIRAVRGPITAATLGLPAATAISDPAVLLPRLDRFAGIAPTGETLFVPHISSDATCDWAAVCARAGLTYQSPSGEAEAIIRRIAGAERIVAESMHAAIIADAFGIPWQGVSLSADFNARKWHDWSQSLGMADPQIHRFYRPLRLAQKLVRALPFRRGTASRSMAPKARDGGAAQHGTVFEMPRHRKAWLEPFAVRDLRASLGRPFLLTDRTALARAQDRFAEMLDGVARDYALDAAS
ncbi:MAG: polysaccharide pyruvyl transferase family protein [Pseudomonadota bacterium]